MMELRWLLIIIGIVIIVAVYFYSRHQHKAKDEQTFFRTPPPDDSLMGEKKTEVSDIPSLHIKVAETQNSETKDNDGLLPKMLTAISDKSESSEVDVPPEPSSEDEPALVILHVWAHSGQYWEGAKLMEVADRAGLTPSDKNIFQYFHQNSTTTPLFHVADKNKPGTFEWDRMEQIKIEGVSLFMELPTFCSAHEAFLLMHACAQRLSNLMEGEILDQSYKPLAQEALDEIDQLCKDIDDKIHDNPP